MSSLQQKIFNSMNREIYSVQVTPLNGVKMELNILLICEFIVSSSNDTYYIQIHHFTQETMLNQWLYYTIQYLELNTKSNGGGNHLPLVADVTINSLVG